MIENCEQDASPKGDDVFSGECGLSIQWKLWALEGVEGVWLRWKCTEKESEVQLKLLP